ncbi:MAG: class I SAM-dependent methyltransferase [Ktedonobacterales bacterium]|nr:class I SAM-dependent methyltransferase [Ktedonobacterales bacterium]
MSNAAAFEAFLRDAEHGFAGWDFGYITDTGRMASEPLPWSYASIVLPHLRTATAALDMGTGGGEFLARLGPFPPHMVATEQYPPNIALARARLTPLGVEVVAIDDAMVHALPFAAANFDLVINRHEYYDPAEVRRILKPGGRFITQQVGGEEYPPIRALLGDTTPSEFAHWTRDFAVAELEGAGFRVTASAEAFPTTRFYDVGALAYHLTAIPWDVPDFSITRHRPALWALHEHIEQAGYVAVLGHRIIVQAQRD